MTAADLARRLDKSTGVVSNWTRGARVPSWESCYEIADMFHVAPETVLIQAGRMKAEDVGTVTEDSKVLAFFHRLTPDSKEQVLLFMEWRRELDRKREGAE
jgi:transcriptional regulator with XRE-family HTH domain